MVRHSGILSGCRFLYHDTQAFVLNRNDSINFDILHEDNTETEMVLKIKTLILR